jgi:DNA-binding CsgD family transcriptional regulator
MTTGTRRATRGDAHPSDPLLERSSEVERIAEAVASARDGRGELLLLDGMPGIGKSSLLAFAYEQAAREKVRVLTATGTELERDLSFGIAIQLFEAPLRAASPADRDSMLAGSARLAMPLLEGSGPATRDAAGALPLFHGLYWLTANIADETPLMLCVDDAHWADRASLGFLLYLAQRLDQLRVTVVVALREREPNAPEDLLAQLAAHRLADVLSLRALSLDAVARLAKSRLPAAGDDVCAACAEASGGNPFLLRELLGDLALSDSPPSVEAVRRLGRLAPESVRRTVYARLQRLPGPAADVARALATLGDASLSHVAALSGVELDAAATAVDVLAAVGLVTIGDPLRFAHPLLRSAVYSSIPQTQRALMHARAFRLLRDTNVAAERVAAHLLIAPPGADAAAVETLVAVGRRALAEGSPDSAVRHLRRALEEPPSADAMGRVLVELGRAEFVVGLPDAATRFSEAAELETEVSARARIRLEHGRALYGTGRLPEAAATFELGAEELGGADAELEADLRAGWATVARLDPSLRPRVQAYVAEVLATDPSDETHGQRVLLAHAAEHLVFAGEDSVRAAALARRALAGNRLLEEETSDGMVWFLAVADLGWCDAYDECDEHVQAGLADARRRGSVSGFANANFLKAGPDYYRGYIAESIADLEQALEAVPHGWEHFLPAVRMQLAWSLIERGDLAAADAALAPVIGDQRWAETSMYALVLGTRARLSLIRGRPEQSLADLLAAGAIATRSLMENPAIIAPWRSWAALAAAQVGDRVRARELVDSELELARRFGVARPIGVALRAAGLVEGGRAGIELLQEAVDVLSGSPAAIEHARSLVDLGQQLARAGDKAGARQHLRRGLDMAHRFEATLIEAQARRALLDTGARPRRARLRGRESLTPSERRVADLAGKGMTNREVADELFVTPKTVEAHLTQVFRKLEVTSRSELAERLTTH